MMEWLTKFKNRFRSTNGNTTESVGIGNEALNSSAPLENPNINLEPTLSEELPNVLDNLNESIKKFNDVSQDQKKTIIQQSSSLHEIAVTSEEIVATSKSISENAGGVEQSALQSLSSCRKGNETLDTAMLEMQSLGGQVKNLVEDIHSLGEQNRHISEIAEVIIEITDQLNLLALNAQIEAVGAGVHGKRFSVVAQEVKRLADNSKNATARIQKNIKKILKDIDHLVDEAQKGLDATNKSIQRINDVANDIGNINEQVNHTHALSQEIKIQTNQQTSAQNQLAQSISEMDKMANESAVSISEQVTTAVMRLSDLAQFLTLILESTVLKTK